MIVVSLLWVSWLVGGNNRQLIEKAITLEPINWKKINTIEDVCTHYPHRIDYIFKNLDLENNEFKNIATAYNKKNVIKACQLLLEYYDTKYSERSGKERLPKISVKTSTLGDSIINDIFTFQNVPGKVPRNSSEHLIWTYTGPEDDIEWAWALNRHYPVNSLLSIYNETGNTMYLSYIDQFIKDWILESTPYPGVKSNTAMWRGLEVSFRVKVWAQIFYDLMRSPAISPATRLLILSSLPDHAHYARNFHAQNNWLTMEISGLATFATFWPEFKKSAEYLEYSVSTMVESLREQVYPDGAQTELSSHYHITALVNFILFKNICDKNNVKLPTFFTGQIENMLNYLAYTIRPNGYGLLNNDSNLDYNRERILKAAEEYYREDWKYIATNTKEGIEPNSLPSVVFPWAGHVIYRNDFDNKAHWSFFDIGPWGSGHQHNDKLHISVSAFGKDFLVDAGRFAYKGEVAAKFRKYATGSKSHNVVLIDGKGQKSGPLLVEKPLSERDYSINEEESFARGSFDKFDELEGVCKHTRTFYYKKDNFWIVVDQITTDRPREIETLWHWHPDCNVVVQGNKILAENGTGSFLIVPISNNNWKINLMKGREYPEIQGWYSKEYNMYEPNFVSVYSCKIQESANLIWLLIPTENRNLNVKAEIMDETTSRVRLKIQKNETASIVSIPIDVKL